MSLTLIQGNSFVSAGVSKRILLPSGANYFKTVNLTQASTTQASGVGVIFEWWKDRTAQDAAMMWQKTNSTNAMNYLSITSGGFTYISSYPSPSAELTGSVISQAAQAACTVTNSYSDGDRVRIYGVVGMRQISGMVFTVSGVSSGGVLLPGLASSGFAAPASSFKIRKIAASEPVLPEYLFITAISQAQQAVIGVSTFHDYEVGMQITFSIPSIYGMQEMNGLTGVIVSVGAVSITVDIDSSNFSAFAFPSSASSVNQIRFATLAPAGQKAYYDLSTNVQYGYNVTEAPFRSAYGQPYMSLAAGILSPAGSTSDVIEWQAFVYGGN